MSEPRTESVETVADFLARFFHEADSESDAVIRALDVMRGRSEDQIRLAHAFADLMEAEPRPNTLRDLVRRHANLNAADDGHAREFLARTYQALALDGVPSSFRERDGTDV